MNSVIWILDNFLLLLGVINSLYGVRYEQDKLDTQLKLSITCIADQIGSRRQKHPG